MTAIELFQFPYSHFNEKARWALDHKAVPHLRRSLLPGPHAPLMLRISGQKSVPVLRRGALVVAGSSRLIAWLEETHPLPPLYPAQPADLERALEIERWFDEQIGPEIRRSLFHTLLREPAYLRRSFSGGHGTVARAAYRACFPAVRWIMRRDMRVDDAGAERGRERTREALDFVAREAGTEGYLAGRSFSVADLCAASLLAPAVMPPDTPMAMPEPRPEGVRAWLAAWADHPGSAWVRAQYARHRPPSAARSGDAGV